MLVCASGTRAEMACRLNPRALIMFCTEAAMKLRLVEQACGCSTVQVRRRGHEGAC